MQNPLRRPLALVILDGWGISHRTDGNAIALAHTPNYDEIAARFPRTSLAASGTRVGLAPGMAGNADVGHMNIGAGRVVQTDSLRIADAIKSGIFNENAVISDAFRSAVRDDRPVHFIGLVSDGEVHAAPETLFELLRMAKRHGVKDAFVHAILDGRDVPQRTADIYIEALEIKMADIGIGCIATLCGRFLAMDNSENWERTARVFTMLVHAEGERASDPVMAVRNSFLRGLNDEFIAPIVIENENGQPVTRIADGDTVVFFNHRADTMRQLARSIAVQGRTVHPLPAKPNVSVVCLTEYDRSLELPVAFPPDDHRNNLSDVLGAFNIHNYRIAESERFSHVTNFFNGIADTADLFEHHIHVPAVGGESPDVFPEMRSFKITDKLLRAIESDNKGVFIANFAAPGIGAESGDLGRAVEAVQYVDTCLGGVVSKMREAGGITLITSTHGGCEEMIRSEAGKPGSPFTLNDVPFHLIDHRSLCGSLTPGGSLEDIAPTILGLIGIEKPAEMTGRDLRGS